ncbi:uncharacterized protein LOC132720338 [Ruditapes philippinarum]|uniref:uncharacterized protein LOC132720338 n=1 Tax=Ruditapes philippinarum TaxID=129788 RepID=UPI00295BAFB2|nr:uncharacterized protein LOC132720338 [Ruditapes philippinarum]
MLKTCCVVLLAFAVVHGDLGEDSVYTAAIDKTVSSDVDDGTNAIFKFLGFKCPKGHRCLPVLECLPCDYGTYKSNEGSDLCENCPNGCTTLRKGAESWKECVPKCPPGYEESKCGKTCTKCRAGYYKSNWKNKLCRKCPTNSNWNSNRIGMKKKSQCYNIAKPECDDYVGNIVFAMDASSAVSEDNFALQLESLNDFVGAFNVKQGVDTTRFAVVTYSNQVDDVILFTDYADKAELQTAIGDLQWSNGNSPNISTSLDYINSNLLFSDFGSDVVPYTVIVVTNGNSPIPSQTAHSAFALKQNVDKVFAVGIGNVNDTELMSIASHQDYVVKVDNTEELTKRLPDLTDNACELLKDDPDDEITESTTVMTPTAGGDRCFREHGTCTLEEYNNLRLTALHGTNCEQFCQCSHASTELDGSVTHYWVEQSCGPGTLFDERISVCNHDYDVECNDTPPPTEAPTQAPTQEPTEPSDESTSAPGGDRCFKEHGTCTLEEYEDVRLTALHGTNCEQFCQCAHESTELDGSVTHYWVEHSCGAGTLFDESISVCNHEDSFTCTDTSPPTQAPTQEPTEPSDESTEVPGEDRCFEEHGTCTLEEYNNLRLTALHGTNCEQFCQCAHESTELDGSVKHYWVEHSCGAGTLFDESISVCNHESSFNCTDISPPTQGPTEAPTQIPTEPSDESTGAPENDRCYAGLGDCSLEDFEDRRLNLLGGTNCRYFCQCAHASTLNTGAVTHYWVEHMCPLGTLFDDSLPGCGHESQVTCSDTGPSTIPPSTIPPSTPAPIDNPGCIEADPCSQHDYEVRRLKPLYGSGCEQFCHCAHQEGSAGTNVEYYWEVQTCPPSTLFDESLPTPVCNHDYNVECEDIPT